MTRRICSIPKCERDVHALTYCVTHYRRVKRSGSPIQPRIRYMLTNAGRKAIGLPPRYVEVPL